jgi:hypothetical protein
MQGKKKTVAGLRYGLLFYGSALFSGERQPGFKMMTSRGGETHHLCSPLVRKAADFDRLLWFLQLLPSTLVESQLPVSDGNIVTDDVQGFVCAAKFEITMIRRKPAVEQLDDLDPMVPQPDCPRRFLPPVTAIAFDLDLHCALARQPVCR